MLAPCNYHIFNASFFFFFLHTGSSTSWLLFDYRATTVGIPVTQLNSLIFNHQVPSVCTSQDPAHSYGSFFSHWPIGSLLFLSQNTLLGLPMMYSADSLAIWPELFACMLASRYIDIGASSKLWKEEYKHYIHLRHTVSFLPCKWLNSSFLFYLLNFIICFHVCTLVAPAGPQKNLQLCEPNFAETINMFTVL